MSADAYASGARLAAAATRRHAVPDPAGSRELVITHGFLIGWFVRHALAAPDDRWLGIDAAHCALTVIRYAPHRRPALVTVNDMSQLTPDLRWTGFPPDRWI